mgnify:CR=1 FL=1|tara:strand:- start:6942 stop:9776 length:2835 start_codon:yes stop_codon:yes gene_type:complete
MSELENPGSGGDRSGAEIKGKIDRSYANDCTPHATPDQIFVSCVQYQNPVGKTYGLKDGKVEKRGHGVRTSPAIGQTLAFASFSDVVAWRVTLTSEFMLTSGTFAELGDIEVVYKDCEVGNQVAASKKHLAHRARPGLLIIDIDAKDEDDVAGLWRQGEQPYTEMDDALAALSRILPEIDDCAFMAGWSTSSNISSPDGELLKGKGGIRIYLPVTDASLIPELLDIMHKRSWLHGDGWAFVDAAGRFQERSLVDLALARPAQVDYAAPVLQDGLTQDREWDEYEGGLLDPAVVEPLNADAEAAYIAAVSVARTALAQTMATQREFKIAAEESEQIKRGVKPARAKAAAINKLDNGVLLVTDAILFDSSDAVSVLDLMIDGAAYDGKTCKDPVDPDYNGGASVGMFYWNDGYGPGIHSFAHGSKWYPLMHDVDSLREVLKTKDPSAVVAAFAQTAFARKSERAVLEKEATKAIGLGNSVTVFREDVAAFDNQVHEQRKAEDGNPEFKGPYPLDQPLPSSIFPFRRDGTPINHPDNYRELLIGYGLNCCYDVIKKEVVWLGLRDDLTTDNAEAVVFAKIKGLASLCGLPSGNSDLQTYLPAIAEANQINPVKDYLADLVWDGKDRLGDLAEAIHPHDLDVARIALRVWFTGAAACCDHFEIGCRLNVDARPSFEYVLAILGGQGVGKTKGFLGLVPATLRSYAKDGLTLNPKDKDSVKTATSYWLAELGELDATFRLDQIAELKAFMSSEYDEYRRPYAATYGKYKRRTAFMGTVNQAQFLKDGTGNRRYLALECGAGFPAWSADEVDQLWAQAWSWYAGGMQWWPTAEEQAQLDSSTDQFRAKSWIEEALAGKYDWGETPEGDRLSATAIIANLEHGRNSPTAKELADVGNVLRRLWEPHAVKGDDGRLRVDLGDGLVKVRADGGANPGWLMPPKKASLVLPPPP